MAIYTNLPVYEECYQLLLSAVNYTRNIQRDLRYTLGEQLKQNIVDILVLIFKANKTKDKAGHIASAREKLVEVQVITRILNDLKQISDRQYVILAEKTTSISKQFVAWEKYATGRSS